MDEQYEQWTFDNVDQYGLSKEIIQKFLEEKFPTYIHFNIEVVLVRPGTLVSNAV